MSVVSADITPGGCRSVLRWGGSNLYMRRCGQQLTLSTEHRAAPPQDGIPLELSQSGSALALRVTHAASAAAPPAET
jgi:hypothetical protein